MAKSPSHVFGEILGQVFQNAVEALLSDFAEEHRLYLDRKGPRKARRGLKKVCWTDKNGNKHDLDFVLARGGTSDKTGIPVAFIEVAWQRYTKHARNKAQEIQGAVKPLAETYHTAAPFLGAILAGAFTEGALTQLKSLGFCVVHLPDDAIFSAFRVVGLDGTCDEDAPDSEFARKVRQWDPLPADRKAEVTAAIGKAARSQLQEFLARLERMVSRRLQIVRILPLHGTPLEFGSVEEAIGFIRDYTETSQTKPVVAYEIQIRYTNGDRVEARFADKENAVRFLADYRNS